MKIVATSGAGALVETDCDGAKLTIDLPVACGGDGSTPSPYQLLFTAIANCTLVYVRDFCVNRDIETSGLAVTLETVSDADHMTESYQVKVTLPERFPDKYRGAVLRAAKACKVSRQLAEWPTHEVTLA